MIIELLAAQNNKIDDLQTKLNNVDVDKISELLKLLETNKQPILSDQFEKNLEKQNQLAERLSNFLPRKDHQ